MSLSYVGDFPLEIICPICLSAIASASAGLAAALPPIAVDLEAALALQVSMGLSLPNLALALSAVAEIAANLTLAISLGAVSLDFQLAAVLSLIAELGPIILALKAAIAAAGALDATLNTGGISVYSWSGTGAAFGPSVTSTLRAGLPDGSPAGASVTGVVLTATSTSAWAGLSSFFAGGTSTASGFTLAGELTLGELAVSLDATIAEVLLSLGVQLGSYQGQLTAALAIQASLLLSPPSLVGNLAIVADLKASFEGYLSGGGFILPTVALEAAAQIVLNLGTLVDQLETQAAALASLTATLATSGILAYTYTGTVGDLGEDLSSAIGTAWPDGTPASAPSNAIVMLAAAPAAQAGLGVFFGGLTA